LHPEITHFHEQYVAIWQQQLAAFEAMDIAIQNDDQSALQAAAAEVEIARGKITPLQAELKALTEYSGIEIVF
jgi:cell division septum initiation protein DivIVA